MLALVVYAVALVVVRNGLTAALVVAAGVQLIPLASPLLLSKDAYAYWGQARLVLAHHASPYRSTPSDFPADPSTPYASEEWRNNATPYGPTWETLAPGAGAGTSHRHAAFAYKLFAALGVLAALGLVAWRTRNAAAVALLGWNLLVALHFGGGGTQRQLADAVGPHWTRCRRARPGRGGLVVRSCVQACAARPGCRSTSPPTGCDGRPASGSA